MTFRGYWDAHEEDLLRRGVQKHGIGSWERIRHDPDFKILKGRTGVQLKDKWRNLVKFQHVGRDEAGRAPVRSHRGAFRRRTARAPKPDDAAGKTAAHETARAARAVVVPEPEPLNDFERARLENIRRNQEALAALMGGVKALPAQINQAVAATPPGRKRPADANEVQKLRERKAAADAALQAAQARFKAAKDAAVRAEEAFARGAGTKAAMDAALASRASLQAAVEQAESGLAAANSALQSVQSGPHAGQAAARKRAKAEPTVPERISARVASKPRKTYAEDDTPLDDEDRREVFVGRVVEDRRFGIYDARRYRVQTADGEDEIADAVVVKSYRDSATYKRRHGIPLEAGEVDDEPDAVALGDAGGAKRGRGRSAAAAEAAPTVDRGGRRRAPVVEPAGKSARGGLGPSRPLHSAPDLAARGERGAPRGMLGPGPALAPSLPPWVSRLPELAAARATPLHAWTAHSLRSALRKDGAAGPGKAAAEGGHQGRRPQKAAGGGRAVRRTSHRPAPVPQSAAAAAAVAASDALTDAGWITDSGPGGFGDLALVSVPWAHHDDAF